MATQLRGTGRWIVVALAIMSIVVAGCNSSTNTAAPNSSTKVGGGSSNELYYWISAYTTLPIIQRADIPALYLAAGELGVQVKIAGPTDGNVTSEISTTEQVCALHPAGVLLHGFNGSQAPSIAGCISAGVPVITVDGDVPGSNRLSYIGTAWSDVGTALALDLKAALGSTCGPVATLSVVGKTNNDEATAAFAAALKGSCLNVVANENDKGVAATAASLTSQILAAHPDLVGIAGVDASSGQGIVQGLREGGQLGKVKVVTIQGADELFSLLKTGEVSTVLVQQRAMFTYWGLQMLYWYNHTAVTVSGFPRTVVAPVPPRVITGLLTVTKDNVDSMLASASASSTLPSTLPSSTK
jgi:ABC-type sugar transport system substrate-binding protein